MLIKAFNFKSISSETILFKLKCKDNLAACFPLVGTVKPV